jgi:hypothetical protein
LFLHLSLAFPCAGGQPSKALHLPREAQLISNHVAVGRASLGQPQRKGVSVLDRAGIEKYAEVMKEIKLRMEVIDSFLSGERETRYFATTIETVGLQFRKIFELIAFASLAVNRVEYSKAYADFEKHWEAAKLIKNLRRINPDFYPQPVIEVPAPAGKPEGAHALQKRQQDYLTQQDLIEAHGKCGSLMHGSNPFGNEIDYLFFRSSFPTWRNKIINLLNGHEVRLLGDTGMWVIHMKEQGHDEVRWYRFTRVKRSVQPI